ncbi:protein farnesyltransferase subunit beta [Sporothrix schenckii 1099-18]|uniref:Protein farnesyltransferase subunit beta n=1 Tax=Sporothrix schenckii 1099-18 TaxID=1397361 RepID=A0A0F2MJR4_SPOSC|nr:protein farnesyltransferase subunit beta [Sporothrix schenckii 1099-18]KJR89867.1 protein farnesyltransferase subunit beta [Sporothrix schenckii 1099-18]
MVSASARSRTTRYRHRAVFIKKSSATLRWVPAMASNPDDTVDEEIPITSGRYDSHDNNSSSSNTFPYRPVQTQPDVMIPEYFTHMPLVRDRLITDTSEMQESTAQMCLTDIFRQNVQSGDPPLNEFGVPRLDRKRHARFLHKSLEPLPGTFVGYDPSRPWFLFWCLNGLRLLGEDVTPYRARLVETARSMQNASGGFGGGHGQSSHLATTYAVVMGLAIVGGEACYEAIDRRALWKWLCALKQPDGGFQMSVGGEEDVRGAYCAAVIISILNLPLDLSPDSPAWTSDKPTLYTGLANYVQRCQTYEGGISAQPGSEAHGGYAFCALGCLSILDSPNRSIPRYLNVPRLVSWLASRQYAPEGGFSGRTNKLVDGCYSHWVGDCWPLVEASLQRSSDGVPKPPQSLFSREGLIRYILCCCQDETKRGGLRDKPGRMSDPYHTCYVLSGLSSAQHKWELVDKPATETDVEAGVDAGANNYSEPVWKASPFPFSDEGGMQVFDEEDRVCTVHPIYTISAERVDQIQAYFRAKVGF